MAFGGFLKKRKARKFKRRRRYKRFGRMRRKLGIPRIGFPTNQVVKMRYSNSFIMNISSGTGVAYLEQAIRANSINSPDVIPDVQSHRPLGWDQWHAFYDRYVVLGSKITLTATMAQAGSDNYIVSLNLNDDPIPGFLRISDIIEQGVTRYSMISPSNNGETINKNLTLTYSAKRWHNVKDVKDADTLEAAFTQNPTDQTYFIIGFGTADGTFPTGSAFITIQYLVDYIVMVKDPQELPRST